MSVDIISIPLGFCQCYVLKGEGIVVLDSGVSKKGAVFTRILKEKGIRFEDVNLVILTHGHYDHIGSASEIKSLTGASLAMHKAEAHWLENSLTPLPPGITVWGKIFIRLNSLFMPFIKIPPSEVDLILDDEGLSLADCGIPGQVVYTPGHSSGSVSVLLDSGEAFVGDLAMNKFPLCVSPSLPIFAEDPSAVISSWKKLIKLGASKVYPAHGKPFPISFIQKAIS